MPDVVVFFYELKPLGIRIGGLLIMLWSIRPLQLGSTLRVCWGGSFEPYVTHRPMLGWKGKNVNVLSIWLPGRLINALRRLNQVMAVLRA